MSGSVASGTHGVCNVTGISSTHIFRWLFVNMLKDFTKFYSEAEFGGWDWIIPVNLKLHYYKKYLRPKDQLDLFVIRGKVNDKNSEVK